MRRLILLLVILFTAAGARPALAQGGMPDMSKAPPAIQAIWKKVMTGGIPTPAEAKKLQAYMTAHRAAIIAGAKAAAAAAKKMAGAVHAANKAAAKANQQVGCPARSPALAGLPSTGPGAGAAARFLGRMRETYQSRESAAGRHDLGAITTRVTSARGLDVVGALLAANGKAGAAVVVYAAAAQKGGATQRAAWSGLGAALELAGDDPHAVSAFRRALAIGPRTAVDVYGLGVAYADLGDMSTGIRLLTEATRLAPKFGMAWDALGRAQSCTGAASAAIASMAQAQQVDWMESREAQVFGPESDDDHVEAKKPFPKPPSIAPIPPPRPPNFPFQVPNLPGNWLESRNFDAEMLGVAGQYQAMLAALPAQEQAAENAAQRTLYPEEATPGPAHSFEFDMNIDNSREVNAATDRLDQRMGARQALIIKAYDVQSMIILKRAGQSEEALIRARQRCDDRTDDTDRCELAYCRAEIPFRRATYAQNLGLARVLFGGLSEVAANYDKAMRAWIMYATDPVDRLRTDADRREQIVNIERFIFTTAEGFGLGQEGQDLVNTCKAVAKDAALAKAARDAAAKAGKCGSKMINLNIIFSVHVDCNDIQLGIGIPDTPIGFQAELRGATNRRHGELFLGLGNSITGVAGGAIGMQANFDQSGLVTTAGLGVHESVGNWLVGSENYEQTVNMRSSGPSMEDGATFSTGAAFQGDLSAFPGHFLSVHN